MIFSSISKSKTYMARKKSDIPKPATSGIIDFIKLLTTNKKEWKDLTPQDQKAFQPYIVNRWLSMDLFLCEAINELQQYTIGMDKDVVWKLYYELLPKERVQINYIKTKESNLFTDEELNCFKKYFGVSERECIEYLDLLKKMKDGNLEIDRIIYNFQEPKKIK